MLTWVPREEQSRQRPPGFHALKDGLSAESIARLNPKEGDGFAIVSEETAFARSAVSLVSDVAPEAPVLVLSDAIDPEDLPAHPCLRANGLRSLIRDDVDEEFSHLTNLRLVVEIRALLEPREKVGILLQPDPDPDGIAAGYALRALLGRKSPTAPLISFGEVKRPENIAMVKALDLTVRTVTPEELEEFDALALVDVQPTVFGDSPPARVLSVDVVIDHHPERSGYDAVIRDIRQSYGATSTILTEYLQAAGMELRPKLATALTYGIKSDTQLLGRETSPHDIRAFAELHGCHSPAILRRIERPALPGDALRALGLERQVGDLVFSVRNVGYVRAAGEVVRAVVEGLGVGGGHRSMAKGIIPLKAFRKVYGSATRQRIAKVLRKAFTEAIEGD